MNCIIDRLLTEAKAKGKRLDVIRRYMRMKYKIQIDTQALQERLRTLQLEPGV